MSMALRSIEESESDSDHERPLSPHIEPDDFDGSEDNDSCNTSTKSVRESIFNFIRENGRTYHAYQAGSYYFPNDQPEIERMDLQFEIFKVLFGGKNYFVPLHNPRKILDIGTGTGKWCVEIAHQFPHAEITGTDLSPIQPPYYPDNIKFVIDDASEEDWMVRPDSFDYIHSRALLGSFEDFREVIKKSFKYLKPGGWLESQEIMHGIYCDDHTMRPDYPFADWIRTLDQSAMESGRPLRIANKLKRWFEAAGFVNVREEIFKLPINSWPRDPQLKMLGRFSEQVVLDGLQGFSLAFFHRALGWTKEEIEVYLVQVRKSIQDRNVHAYHKIYVVYGQKPEAAQSTQSPPVR